MMSKVNIVDTMTKEFLNFYGSHKFNLESLSSLLYILAIVNAATTPSTTSLAVWKKLVQIQWWINVCGGEARL